HSGRACPEKLPALAWESRHFVTQPRDNALARDFVASRWKVLFLAIAFDVQVAFGAFDLRAAKDERFTNSKQVAQLAQELARVVGCNRVGLGDARIRMLAWHEHRLDDHGRQRGNRAFPGRPRLPGNADCSCPAALALNALLLLKNVHVVAHSRLRHERAACDLALRRRTATVLNKVANELKNCFAAGVTAFAGIHVASFTSTSARGLCLSSKRRACISITCLSSLNATPLSASSSTLIRFERSPDLRGR